MHHRGTEDTEAALHTLTEQIIGAAIDVHRVLGPGLLESAYEECLAWELTERQVPFARQVALPVVYKGGEARLRSSNRSDRGGCRRSGSQVRLADSASPRSSTPYVPEARWLARGLALELQRFRLERRHPPASAVGSQAGSSLCPPCLCGGLSFVIGDPYSYLSACIGSTFEARRAGM